MEVNLKIVYHPEPERFGVDPLTQEEVLFQPTIGVKFAVEGREYGTCLALTDNHTIQEVLDNLEIVLNLALNVPLEFLRLEEGVSPSIPSTGH